MSSYFVDFRGKKVLGPTGLSNRSQLRSNMANFFLAFQYESILRLTLGRLQFDVCQLLQERALPQIQRLPAASSSGAFSAQGTPDSCRRAEIR